MSGRGPLRWWDSLPTFVEHLPWAKHQVMCRGFKHTSRCSPGLGRGQGLRERREHRPFCFRALAASSSREADAEAETPNMEKL